MFSKTFGYAIRAVLFVAIHEKEGKKVGLQVISQALDIPHHFLGKIMQELVKNGILDSVKGPSGGFYTNRMTAKTPLLDMLKITDGNMIFDQCALGIKKCTASHPCPLHGDFATCRDGMLNALAGKSIETLTSSVENGDSFLVR